MSKLYLPDVTLMMVDILCYDMARLSLEDSLRAADYGDVVVFSDQRIPGISEEIRWVQVPRWPSSKVFGRWMWSDLADHLKTSHFLLTEWDCWVTNPEMWTDEFLEYDYIGAPWWTPPGNYNVGNGCGLRSRRLMQYLKDHPTEFFLADDQEPFQGNDDTTMSIIYRPALERAGFRWADEQLASRLAFEYTRPSLTSKHFMFHDSFNFPQVLEGERLAERIRLMQENTVDAKMPTHLAMLAEQPNGDPTWHRGGVPVIRPSLAWEERGKPVVIPETKPAAPIRRRQPQRQPSHHDRKA